MFKPVKTADILLVTPPFIQPNTPYPATPSLMGFLKDQGFNATQLDLSIACFLQIFSAKGLQIMFDTAEKVKCSANSKKIIQSKNEYIRHIDAVISFLQGKDTTFAHSIANGVLPKAKRFNIQQNINKHFGTDGIQDKARFFATLFIEDLSDFITECVDSRFGLSRYAEQIGLNITDFQTVLNELEVDSPITSIMLNLLDESIKLHNPKVVGFTIPFPGNFLMSLKSAQYIKNKYPEIKIVLGGGFVSTELRELNEPNLFQLVDYVCLDDGELPILKILQQSNSEHKQLSRTFVLENGKVTYNNLSTETDFAHSSIGTPNYDGLPISDYISVTETTNAMHNLWSSARWNKMVLAHGCYWHKCAFCDTSLDYINRYSTADAKILCDRIEAIIEQTGCRGFHFVDEAAAPNLLRKLAEELLLRQISITWWTNIRFEKAFTPELCKLLAASGCIAVSGGIEVASDRLLQKMEKGVTIEQLVKSTSAFRESGIMIHAYLMYGFPTQTSKETIDSLEVVRQLFKNKLIQSAFWHRFTLTVHSPIGKNPEKYGIKMVPLKENSFAKNAINHIDTVGCNPEKYSEGLVTALYNYMHNNGINYDLQTWFDFKIPKTGVHPNYISQLIPK
jgi:radical SAM superfamily enzyme YgiQ (UPF0313 family)